MQIIRDFESVVRRYKNGHTVAELAPIAGVSAHTLRRRLLKAGVMRSVEEARAIAKAKGRFAINRRARGPMSDAQKEKLREAHLKLNKGRGYRVTTNGYVEYTKGEHAGRSEHVVLMEKQIGRRLLPTEVVHHIDGNRQNNAVYNLLLMTRGEHSRLHRQEEILSGRNHAHNFRN